MALLLIGAYVAPAIVFAELLDYRRGHRVVHVAAGVFWPLTTPVYGLARVWRWGR